MAENPQTKDDLLKEIKRLESELGKANAKLNVYAEKHRRDDKTIAEYLVDRNK